MSYLVFSRTFTRAKANLISLCLSIIALSKYIIDIFIFVGTEDCLNSGFFRPGNRQQFKDIQNIPQKLHSSSSDAALPKIEHSSQYFTLPLHHNSINEVTISTTPAITLKCEVLPDYGGGEEGSRELGHRDISSSDMDWENRIIILSDDDLPLGDEDMSEVGDEDMSEVGDTSVNGDHLDITSLHNLAADSEAAIVNAVIETTRSDKNSVLETNEVTNMYISKSIVRKTIESPEVKKTAICFENTEPSACDRLSLNPDAANSSVEDQLPVGNQIQDKLNESLTPKRMSNRLTNIEKIDILIYRERNPFETYNHFCNYFSRKFKKSIGKTAIFIVLKNRLKWASKFKEDAKLGLLFKYIEVEQKLNKWHTNTFKNSNALRTSVNNLKKVKVTDQEVLHQAKLFAFEKGIESIYSYEWLKYFKSRYIRF